MSPQQDEKPWRYRWEERGTGEDRELQLHRYREPVTCEVLTPTGWVEYRSDWGWLPWGDRLVLPKRLRQP